MSLRPSFTFSLASPASTCPQSPAAERKPPAGESSQRTALVSLPAVFAPSPARLPSLSHPLPPSAPPPDAPVAPCWEWQTEVCLPQLANRLRIDAILNVAGSAAHLRHRSFLIGRGWFVRFFERQTVAGSAGSHLHTLRLGDGGRGPFTNSKPVWFT